VKIVRAKVLGFCMGVRRAVELATSVAKHSAADGASSVYTLGSLIHNPKVLENLSALGVQSVSSLEELPQNEQISVIIRAHGISPEAEKDLRDKGFNIIDATCPKVKASQLKARELSKEGYYLFLAGEAEHAEVIGVMGYASSAPFCTVVGSEKESREAAFNLYNKNSNVKTALLGQTTISQYEYETIADEIKKYFPNLEVIQTICAATAERQQALRELLLEADAVIIAGGNESANTRRLFAIAQESGKPCVLAEDAAQVPKSFYDYNVVGLCAGASTPDSVVDEIENKLLSVYLA